MKLETDYLKHSLNPNQTKPAVWMDTVEVSKK